MSSESGGQRSWDLDSYRRGEPRYDLSSKVERALEQDQLLALETARRKEQMVPVYDREGPSLFALALSGAMLSVLTLGLYRFWLITSLRRHYWQAIRLHGDPLEYTGTGFEKLTGFFGAIIALAVYLTVVNIGLAYVGMSVFDGHPAANSLNILFALPLIFFARYRSRRYMLARTRWRGIRFGMTGSGVAYAFRALWLWFLTVISLGMLYPYQQFKLQQYMVNRTWYGDLKFEQKGSWAALFAYWVWIYIIVVCVALAIWGIAADNGNVMTAVVGGLIVFIGYFAFFLMFMRYEMVAYKYMWNHRSLGESWFTTDIQPTQVVTIYLIGTLAVIGSTIVAFIALFIVGGAAMAAVVGPSEMMKFADVRHYNDLLSAGPFVLVAGLSYVGSIVAAYAFTHVYVTRPVLRRKAETMLINKARALMDSQQRAHDHAADAGGFADALGMDVGAGV